MKKLTASILVFFIAICSAFAEADYTFMREGNEFMAVKEFIKFVGKKGDYARLEAKIYNTSGRVIKKVDLYLDIINDSGGSRIVELSRTRKTNPGAWIRLTKEYNKTENPSGFHSLAYASKLVLRFKAIHFDDGEVKYF